MLGIKYKKKNLNYITDLMIGVSVLIITQYIYNNIYNDDNNNDDKQEN